MMLSYATLLIPYLAVLGRRMLGARRQPTRRRKA
jgi:hypothetical protein